MNMDSQSYKKFAKAHAPKSPIGKDCFRAFWVGGVICAFAEALLHGYRALNMNEENAKTLVPVTLIFLAALLTGFGIFDDIARFAGAGTLVPITGFANAVVSPAVDAKSEGMILGVGAKIFSVAGPVLLYGTLAGTLYGVVYWVANLLK